MKANWKIALMCIATIAFVACKEKNKPTPPGPDDPDITYDSKVDVRDNSYAEWETLPAEFVASATLPEDASALGLKWMKVYADQVYINILFEFDPEEIVHRNWVPLHVIFNTDNNDATGGYGAQFTDANEDVLLEGSFMAAYESYDYNPSVFKYWGTPGKSEWDDAWFEPGVTPSAENNWGAYVAEGNIGGKSQVIDGNKVEIQLIRELIPCSWAPWADKFGIGIVVQHVDGDDDDAPWIPNVGYLPQTSPTDANPNGFTNKLTVTIDMSE